MLPRLPSISNKQERILVFDSECRPAHYSEYRPESQITGIAWSWVGDETVNVITLKQDLSNEGSMLRDFFVDYHEATRVVGHYIRKHDLPLLSDHAFRFDIPMKGCVTEDTMDIVKVKGLGKSQANLAETLGLSEDKFHMNGASWRVANGLTPEGRAGTRERVRSDVEQNKALYLELRKRGLLQAPKAWRR